MKKILFCLLFASFTIAAAEKDICGKDITGEGLTILEAMNKVNKVLVMNHKADTVFYACNGQSTWQILQNNNFPESFPNTNVAIIRLNEKSTTATTYSFNIVGAGDAYDYADLASVQKMTGEVVVE